MINLWNSCLSEAEYDTFLYRFIADPHHAPGITIINILQEGGNMDTKQVVTNYHHAWTNGDLEAARSYLTDDLDFQGSVNTFRRIAKEKMHLTGSYAALAGALCSGSELGPLPGVPSSVLYWLPSADSNHGHGG